jgi:hypothetical protein
VCSSSIIGPYFFEDDAERYVTVQAEMYKLMLANELHHQFQQDEATAHTTQTNMAALCETFPQ